MLASEQVWVLASALALAEVWVLASEQVWVLASEKTLTAKDKVHVPQTTLDEHEAIFQHSFH